MTTVCCPLVEAPTTGLQSNFIIVWNPPTALWYKRWLIQKLLASEKYLYYIFIFLKCICNWLLIILRVIRVIVFFYIFFYYLQFHSPLQWFFEFGGPPTPHCHHLPTSPRGERRGDVCSSAFILVAWQTPFTQSISNDGCVFVNLLVCPPINV